MFYSCQYVCNQAKTCRKKYKENLRLAILTLKQNQNSSANTVLFTLSTTNNLLSGLICPTGFELQEKITCLSKQIKPKSEILNSEEKRKLNVLIAELEAFSNS